MYCSYCHSHMIIDTQMEKTAFQCRNCNFSYSNFDKVSNTFYPKLKQVDDILGGSAAWDNVDATDETCPKCEHKRAYFMQVQTRSADEPMTNFYKCCNASCNYRWKE